jgi:hypothetical protein
MSTKGWRLSASLAVAAGSLVASQASAAISVDVLSSRPELVTGGDALIKVSGASAAPTITVDGKDVAVAFKPDPKGGFVGLVTGLKDGDNMVAVKAGADGANVKLVNHPINGTLFAGPQQTPFYCELDDDAIKLKPAPGAKLDPHDNPDCAAVTTVNYFYRDKMGNWKPFDATNRPADIGMTTTSDGKNVPLIVRQEKGVINRSAYVINILHDPAAGPLPTPTDKGGSAWNGKLMYSFGGGVQANFHMGRKYGDLDPRYDLMEERNVGFVDAFITKGYAIAGGTLNVGATNNDDVKSAETAYKVKERFIEEFGPPIYTVGTGVSDGSIQQHMIGNDYPGIMDGLLPGRSYADTMTFLRPLYDCELLINLFKKGGTWTRDQMDAISGKYWGYCVSNGTRYPNARPDFCDLLVAFAEPDPKTAPRCTFQDNLVNVFGVDPKTGYARNPFDNNGVQYGLVGLNKGIITFDQFLDINTRIGGLDVNGKIVPQRQIGDDQAIKAAYETGRIVEMTGGMKEVPAISIRSYNDQDPLKRGDPNVDVHDGYHTNVVLARLLKYNGTRDSYVQFMTTTMGFPQLDTQTGPGNVLLPNGSPLYQASVEALNQLDKWILAIQGDKSNKLMAQKVIDNKPKDLVDTCWPTKQGPFLGQTERLTDWAKCEQLFPLFGDARLAAGEPLTDDNLKCQLKPIDVKDYKVAPTPDQMAKLQAAFPTGVCDYSKPGVQQTQKIVTWAMFTGKGTYAGL